jgi:2-methylcitrate dehydratase PrpD
MKAADVTGTFAEWLCAHRHEDLPAAVRTTTGNVVYDSVGAMVACSALPEVLAIVRVLEAQGGREDCTIIGRPGASSLLNAAMANGGMAHGDEVDPVHATSVGGHVAAGPVPTALSVGEWLDASGRDVLHAVALGYELGGRLMPIFYRERDYVTRRFYHTAIAANLSSAVTAGVLLGLDANAMRVALCLATYQAAGPDNMTKDPMHMGKTFQVGAANRNGVTAALLAREGCHTPPDILDGTHGLFDAYLANPEASTELVADLGQRYAISDVMHKRYSAGSPNQTYLQGLFGILRDERIAPEDIDELEIHIPKRGVHRVPTTRHASISALKVSAIAAAKGKLDFYALHEPGSGVDAAVEAMERRVRFVGREDWAGMEHGRHAVVIVRTRSGRTYERDVWHEPMTRAELEFKFRELVTPKLKAAKTAALETLLNGLESARSVRPLMLALRGEA